MKAADPAPRSHRRYPVAIKAARAEQAARTAFGASRVSANRPATGPRSGELRCRRPVRTRSLPARGFDSREGLADTATGRQNRRKARRIKSGNAITGGWGKRPCKTNAARRAGVWNSWALPRCGATRPGFRLPHPYPTVRTLSRQPEGPHGVGPIMTRERGCG
jgi:hypothetical protein